MLYGRKVIALRLSRRAVIDLQSNVNLTFGDLPTYCGFEPFNPAHTHIIGVQWNDYEGHIGIGFTHPEFPMTPDSYLTPEFHLKEMKSKFPYLFQGSTTNPILWRNFKDDYYFRNL